MTCIFTIIFVAMTRQPSTNHPVLGRMLFIFGNTLLWSIALVWVIPVVEELIGTTSGSIWFYWLFSMPIILILTYLHSNRFNRGYEWQALFFEDKDQSLQDIFLRVNETIKIVKNIRKSELKSNSK